MKKLNLIFSIILAAALSAGCSSFRAVELEPGFWQTQGARIGIVMTGTDMTRVRIEPSSLFEPILPGYETSIMSRRLYNAGGEFGTRGNMSAEIEAYGRYTEQRGPFPYYDNLSLLRAEAEDLRAQFRDLDNGVFREIRERLREALARDGRQVTFMEGQAEGPGQPGASVDVLMTVDCGWYGVICHYVDFNPVFTDVAVHLHGRMVEAGSGKILWRSPDQWIRNPVPCRCGNPNCLPVIRDALDNAVREAAGALIRDLVTNRAPDGPSEEIKPPS